MAFVQALQQGMATIQQYEAGQNPVQDLEIYAESVEFEGIVK